MKKLITLLGIVCLFIVIAQGIGVGVLWFRGELTPENISALQAVFSEDAATTEEDLPPVKVILPAHSDVTRERSMRVLGLEEREMLLNALREMVEAQAAALETSRAAFAKEVQGFDDRLAALEAENTTAATEQTRGILQKMRSSDAKESLKALPIDKAVRLLRGLPDDAIAGILQQFQKGDEADQARGQELFGGLSEGEPKKTVIEDAQSETAQGGTVP